MRTVILGLVWMSILTAFTTAQEIIEPIYESTPVDRPFADAPNPSDHAGLLGKLFMQEQYLHFKLDDPFFDRVDPDAQGSSTLLNLPLSTLNAPEAIDVDLFFAYGQLGSRGGARLGPPVDEVVRLNARTDQYVLGASFYPTYAGRVRPYAQLGVTHTRDEIDLIVGPNLVMDQERKTEALANLGLEADLLPSLAYRGRFHVETSDSINDSSFSSELILWLHDRVYIRGGVSAPLSGDWKGFALGGGIAF